MTDNDRHDAGREGKNTRGAGARSLLVGLLAFAGASGELLACTFPAGYKLQATINPGDLYVGRDAPVGTVIISKGQSWIALNAGSDVLCPQLTNFDVRTPRPVIHGSPLVPPGDVILATPIPGIGVVLGAALGYGALWSFVPGDGWRQAGVPYRASVFPVGGSTQVLTHLTYAYRIIKIGDIDPGAGPQSLDGIELATFDSDRSGRIIDLAFAGGSINVAQCGLPSAPGAQIRVAMGTWRTGQFRGEGTVTDAKGFAVPLQACQAGTLPGNQNFAELRLDTRNGSQVIDAQRGILGLNDQSDATGVGVQVLKADLTPMPLNEEVRMSQLPNGAVQLNLAARYIQVGKDTPVGGVANASLGFTLTYK